MRLEAIHHRLGLRFTAEIFVRIFGTERSQPTIGRDFGQTFFSAAGDESRKYFAEESPDAVVVSLTEPEGSARLRWRGTVTSLAPHGDAVRLLVRAGPDLLADVTAAAVLELGLTPGREVWLSVKATAVRRYAAESPGR